MRIQVRFNQDGPVRLPIAQNYFLASAIYTTLGARPEYARFLHDRGYTHQDSGRSFKLFVFSSLMCARRRIEHDEVVLGPGGVTWVISSPMPEFVTALAEGLLSRGQIEVRGTALPISSVEALPEPELSERMNFTCLSPIIVSRPDSDGGYAHFCLHTDNDFSERVRNNLIRKHELIYGNRPGDDRFVLKFDENYISRREGKVTKLIDIRGTKLRGVLAPFEVTGSVELMRVAYEAGIGERGSMGFGAVEVIKQVERRDVE